MRKRCTWKRKIVDRASVTPIACATRVYYTISIHWQQLCFSLFNNILTTLKFEFHRNENLHDKTNG